MILILYQEKLHNYFIRQEVFQQDYTDNQVILYY